MPFKLTYAHFKSPEFEFSLNRLCNTFFDEQAVAYNLAKILRRYKKESADAQKSWESLYKPYILRDEHGIIVPLDGRPGTFQIREECREEWDRRVEEYNLTAVPFDCHQITFDICKVAKLTPKELVELEPLIAP